MEVLSKETHVPVQDVDGQLILQKEPNNTLVLMLNKITQEIVYVPANEDVKTEFNILQNINEPLAKAVSEKHLKSHDNDLGIETSDSEEETKIWNQENVLYLIESVKQFDQEFSCGMKKYVWEKVAQKCKHLNKNISAKQCETKWKSLKRTYKTILAANNTSGQKRRYWEFFNVMHDMFHKPEISPVATCSSSSGLQVNVVNDTTEQSRVEALGSSEDKVIFESSFIKKRKLKTSEAERRHVEKIQRLDRFNDRFEKMIDQLPNPQE